MERDSRVSTALTLGIGRSRSHRGRRGECPCDEALVRVEHVGRVGKQDFSRVRGLGTRRGGSCLARNGSRSGRCSHDGRCRCAIALAGSAFPVEGTGLPAGTGAMGRGTSTWNSHPTASPSSACTVFPPRRALWTMLHEDCSSSSRSSRPPSPYFPSSVCGFEPMTAARGARTIPLCSNDWPRRHRLGPSVARER